MSIVSYVLPGTSASHNRRARSSAEFPPVDAADEGTASETPLRRHRDPREQNDTGDQGHLRPKVQAVTSGPVPPGTASALNATLARQNGTPEPDQPGHSSPSLPRPFSEPNLRSGTSADANLSRLFETSERSGNIVSRRR